MISLAVLLVCLAVVNVANAMCIEGKTTSCPIGGQEGIKECIGGHWGPCEIAPDPEPSPLAPYPPQGLAATMRAHTSIQLRWYDQATNEQGYEVLRSDSLRHGPWVPLAWPGGQAGKGSPMYYTDTGLHPDTVYCYWVKVFNDHGTGASPQSCVYTRDGNDYTASRAQIVLHTADREDANTDDAVFVALNGDASAAPIGNWTWLDYGRNDFERGDTFTYDLNLDKIDDVGDITQIVVGKLGEDGWCLTDFTLKVDEVPVFSQAFGDLPEGCLWLDTDVGESTSHIVSHAMLRADPQWTTFVPPLPAVTLNPDGTITAEFTKPRSELEERIEAMVGHSIHGTDAYWGKLYDDRWVEATMNSSSHAKVDLDLAADVFASDPEVDIDFNLVAGTHQSADGNWHLDLAIANVTAEVDLAWWEDLLDLLPCGPVASVIDDSAIPFCLAYLAEKAADQIEASFPRLQQSFGVGSRPLSLTAAFDSDTNLVVTAILPPLSAPSPDPDPGPGDPGPDPEPQPNPDPEPQPDPDPAPCASVSATAPNDVIPSLRRNPRCDV